MISGYTSNLAAQLTVRVEKKHINSLHDLVNNPDIIPLAENGTNVHSLFRVSTIFLNEL